MPFSTSLMHFCHVYKPFNPFVVSYNSTSKNNIKMIIFYIIFNVVVAKFININIKEEFYPDSKIETRVSGVKVEKNQDPEKFRDFWKNYVDNVVMVEMENRWDTYHNPKEIMAPGPCNYLWERMYIWYDGLCNPCDIDYKRHEKNLRFNFKDSEGDILNVDITTIINGWHDYKDCWWRIAGSNR